MVVFTGNASRLAATTILLTVLALGTYAPRVYCRLSRRAWGPEDWVMTIALVSYTGPREAHTPETTRHSNSIRTDPIRRPHRGVSWGVIQRHWRSRLDARSARE